MSFYTDKSLKTAIDQAVNYIELKNQSCKDYIRGYNDCFAFALAYERSLRKDKSLTTQIDIRYNTPQEFLPAIGCKSFEEVADKFKFSIVQDRIPQTGDIIIEVRKDRIMTLVCDGEFWLAPCEKDRKVKKARRVYKKEIRAVLHVRPIYLEEE